jgi:hypothetical protein
MHRDLGPEEPGVAAAVLRLGHAGEEGVRRTATATGRTCTAGRLVPGRAYFVLVQARNAVGASAATARVKVIVKR